ncbi:choline BCCT transporter BetT [Janibacter alkaliphilus]|uniref:Choline/glycine/proline betaine transport protein n=1 Tax=Janibacter alkaliphilus TaxID=1069963 RepID=A0A852X5H6_9MICO|nr:choline BCCT transporter BetT [Janibacter alkaliphilus]NYG36650.1 choline/glycine/proline betaine transport protein [Janibacter alkaliphilus]
MSTTTDPATPPGQETRADRPRKPTPKIPVLTVAGVITVIVAGWALIAPESSGEILGSTVGWISEWFGWFYIALATVVLVFVLYVGLRYSKVRLGSPDDRPEFSTFAWASMLFAAGIGTDVMFYAVAEPASQFLAPPQGDGGTLDAARESTVWTLFHYGITGWGMYALMGIALGFAAYRKGLPLAVRSTLYPLIGKRVRGPIGDAVDIATVLGTIFGVATSLGIGVVMLNVGLDLLFGIEQGTPAQIALVVVAVLVATISATTGVDKGIRLLSQLNVLLAIALAAWVLITRDTAFLLRAAMMNVGDFVSMFPGITMDTMAYDYDADWMGGWTLFFWAWWIAWACFVGMFLARISKGRTIGQFVLGTMTIPFSYIVMWVTIFGNSAVQKIMDGDAEFGEAAMNTPELGFFTLLQDTPGATVLVALATFVGLLFYVTSADSGALVMANLSSDLPDNDTDAAPSMRIVWAAATGVLTIAMLTVDGIPALQSATIIMGLPFAFVMILVMWALHRALEEDRVLGVAQRVSLTRSIVGHPSGSGSWRRRLSRTFGTVTVKQAEERLDDVVLPSLQEVAGELTERGVVAEVSEDTGNGRIGRTAKLVVPATEIGYEDFCYLVQVRRTPAPSYGARMLEADDTTTLLEVALPTGVSYDLMDYDGDEVCHDVLDHYERWANSSAAVADHGS